MSARWYLALILVAACESAAPAPAPAPAAFTAVKPCDTPEAYLAGSTVTFGADGQPAISYSPACLEVTRGATVAFLGDFSAHPMFPSAGRNTNAGNPIAVTQTGTRAAFTFTTPGFYAYYCQHHGPTDDGSNMSGVVWVTP
jgi:plastocyanin